MTATAAGDATTAVSNLSTRGLTKVFGGVRAVDGADVTFHEGKINALIGPNGSGKTTFFNCVTGMIKPDSGTVTFKGRDITGKAPHAIAHAGIGRSFQLCRIFPRMTVLDNVLVAVRRTGIRGLLAPARTPRPIVDALNRQVQAILLRDDIRQQLQDVGMEVAPTTPEQFQQTIAQEISLHAQLVKAAGLVPQ